MRWFVIHWHGATIGRHSLSHALWACQLPQRGSREGCVPFIVPVGNRDVAGDFHRPYATQRILVFTIHRTTLPQSRPAGVPAPSEREPGGAGAIQRAGGKPGRWRAIFIAPTQLREFWFLPFIGRHSLSHARWACQLPQRGSREGRVPFNVPVGNRNVAGDFHRPYEECVPFIGVLAEILAQIGGI